MDQNKDIAGVYGSSRVTYLKEQFKNIIDNALVAQTKSALFLFDRFDLKEWLKYKNAEMDNSQTGLENIRMPSNYESIKIDPETLEFMKANGEKLMLKLTEFREIIQHLVCNLR